MIRCIATSCGAASSGLGAEFAVQAHDVILVARSGDRPAALAERLIAEHGVGAHALVQDLAEPGAARRVAGQLAARGLSVDLLVGNAGSGSCGRFGEISGARDHDQMTVNVVALVDLAMRPGPVEAACADTVGTRRAAVTGSMATPAPVVRAALRALECDRGGSAPGLSNTPPAHLTPRRLRTLAAAIAEHITGKVLALLAVTSTVPEHAV
ncbi:SDR family NAD(P)-dependent oxidoreductase [Micromonospora sp. NPDC047670]|uniref:SDR family NAD(P)-dependent oxidoreductase n=1 Tax=Micromonospora sp. NPDC047670 TaxID=3364252 RepID=UPI0037103FBE